MTSIPKGKLFAKKSVYWGCRSWRCLQNQLQKNRRNHERGQENEFFPARLKWSHATGSPRHPGDPELEWGDYVLRMLDCGLLDRLQSKLPSAADGPEHVDIEVRVTVRFERQERKQRRQGGEYCVWVPVSASMLIFNE